MIGKMMFYPYQDKSPFGLDFSKKNGPFKCSEISLATAIFELLEYDDLISNSCYLKHKTFTGHTPDGQPQYTQHEIELYYEGYDPKYMLVSFAGRDEESKLVLNAWKIFKTQVQDITITPNPEQALEKRAPDLNEKSLRASRIKLAALLAFGLNLEEIRNLNLIEKDKEQLIELLDLIFMKKRQH